SGTGNNPFGACGVSPWAKAPGAKATTDNPDANQYRNVFIRSPSLLHLYRGAGARGSGVPGAIGGDFFRLSSNSATIFIAGPAVQLLRSPVCGNSSFGSVTRSNTLGTPSFAGGVNQSRCSS